MFLVYSFGFNKHVFFYFFFRHKILDMLTKNPPFTKNMESPLCNEALVDQLWKLMNSGLYFEISIRLASEYAKSCLGFGT